MTLIFHVYYQLRNMVHLEGPNNNAHGGGVDKLI
jgi:hypothetical protein